MIPLIPPMRDDPSVIEIDLSAVSHNMAVIRRIVGPDCVICPVVKADAYGLGAVPVARCVTGAGAGMLAVYAVAQAAELVRGVPGAVILVLMPVRDIAPDDALDQGLAGGRVHLSVHAPEQLDDLIRLAQARGIVLPVHVEIDTGMSRGGCDLADAPHVLRRAAAHRHLHLAGVYTQFAASESDPVLTERQDARLEALLEAERDAIPPDCLIHAANTCATLRTPALHRSMVRIGQAWAGYGPESIRGGPVDPQAAGLRPVLTWSSRLVHLKTIEAGATVGYGAAWSARRRSLIGLVPAGYADGYPYALSRRNGSDPAPARVAVLLDGPGGVTRAYAPVVGNVNMDQITLDLTDVGRGPGGRGLRVGTQVELITADAGAPNHLVTIARAAGTTPHEILCRLNPRIRRVYHRAGAVVEVLSPARTAAAAV